MKVYSKIIAENDRGAYVFYNYLIALTADEQVYLIEGSSSEHLYKKVRGWFPVTSTNLVEVFSETEREEGKNETINGNIADIANYAKRKK